MSSWHNVDFTPRPGCPCPDDQMSLTAGVSGHFYAVCDNTHTIYTLISAPGSMERPPWSPSMRRRCSAVRLEMAFWMEVREGKRMCSTRRRPRHSSGSGRQWCVLSYLDVRLTSCAAHTPHSSKYYFATDVSVQRVKVHSCF